MLGDLRVFVAPKEALGGEGDEAIRSQLAAEKEKAEKADKEIEDLKASLTADKTAIEKLNKRWEIPIVSVLSSELTTASLQNPRLEQNPYEFGDAKRSGRLQPGVWTILAWVPIDDSVGGG
jgi:chromosome segregation ATPase